MLMDVQTRNQCDSKRWQCRMQSQRGSRQLANSPRFHLHMTTRCLRCMRAFHSSIAQLYHPGSDMARTWTRHSRHPNSVGATRSRCLRQRRLPASLGSTARAGQSAPVYAASPEPPPGFSSRTLLQGPAPKPCLRSAVGGVLQHGADVLGDLLALPACLDVRHRALFPVVVNHLQTKAAAHLHQVRVASSSGVTSDGTQSCPWDPHEQHLHAVWAML